MVGYSFISNTCVGLQVYRDLNPGKNDYIIEYTSPFIGSIFLDDDGFVYVCQNYDRVAFADVGFTSPLGLRWREWGGNDRYEAGTIPDYPVMHLLDGVEVHWIHETPTAAHHLFRKVHDRYLSAREYKKFFLWSASEMMNRHSEEERSKLLKKFMGVDGYSIFLTEREEEKFEDDSHIIEFVPEWKENSQEDRDRFFGLNWNNQQFVSRHFLDVLERKFSLILQ
jgi:hypothetical protein